MASVIQPTPSPPIATAPRAEERLVDERIRQTRRSLKWVDFGSGLLTLIIGVLVFLLSMSVLEHWVIPGGWNGPTRTALFVVMLLGIAWYSWRAFWPLVSRPINPAYAAQLIERSTPSLKNSLLNFLLLRNRRQQLSQKVYQAIEQQAAQRLSEVSLDSVIDRSALLKLGYVLVAVVAICALYRVLSPKNLTASMERVLMPWSNTPVPSRVEILSVTPGDTQIARGESLEVNAEVLGLRPDEPVRVRYSTLDGQSVDREVSLNGSEGSSRYQGRLPDRFSAVEGNGVQQDFEYWVEAGDAQSEKYRVTVFARPTLVVEKIRYQFPAYMGLPPREVEGTGDVSALEGTKVSIYALANHDIASASLDFGADGRNDLPMSAEKEKATVQFTLALQEDRRTPEHDSYVLQYKTTSGRLSSLPPKYSIDVTPDYVPEVRILKPVDDEGKLVEQLDVPLDSQFIVEVEARDPDFALKNVVLLGDAAGEEVLKHDLLTQEQSGKFVGQFTSTPAELNLKPGDILEYRAAAIDNRQPEPNIAETKTLRIRVLGPPELGKQQGQGQGETPHGGEDGESQEGGQGENGEQGQAGGGAGGEESGEQGESQQGGGQQGKGQSEGDQQGQGAQGGNQGEGQQNGEGASAGSDGNQQGEGTQSGGENGEQQPGEPVSAGGEQSKGAQPGEQGKVSAEGDSDGEAFERMSDHFAEKDGQSEGQQSKGQQGQGPEGDGRTEQSGSAGETQSGEGDGEGSESKQPTESESGRNQDQAIDGEREGEQSEGSGAEGQPNEQGPGEPASAGGEKEDEKQDAPGGKMSTEQGEPGAGNNPGENDGSMDTDAGRKPRDKDGKGPDSKLNDEEASGQANSQKESDSQGSAGGDQSGGGQEGAGQQTDSQGTGTAGENTAANDGAGQSQESGGGEESSRAGQQSESDKPTGKSSENQAGEGSKQSDEESNKAGGEPASAGGEDGEESPAGSPQQNGEGGEQPPQGSQPSGNPGQGPPSGGTGNNNVTPPPPGEMAPGDEANLDYARKQTDLVLDRLDEQLKNNEIDNELLEKLGWTKEELQRFIDRWKALKAEAEQAPDPQGETELDKALRSLGINPNRRPGFQAQVTKEKLRQLQDSYRGQTPLEYADQVRAYIKGTATVPEEKD